MTGQELLQKELSDTAAPVLEHAVATFGSPGKALDWLNSDCGALQHRRPIELLRENQADVVEEELSRIDHGAYV